MSEPLNLRLTRRAALAALCAVGLQYAVAPRARAEEGSATANAPAPVAWSTLTAEEQKVLNRYSDRWSTLAPEQQQRLLRGSRRWLDMTPEQRERAQSRFKR